MILSRFKGLLNYGCSSCMKIALLVMFLTNTALAEDYKIGFLGGITGPVAPLYVPFINGIEDTVKYANANGMLGQDKIELLLRDDGYRADKAKKGFEELLDNEVLSIVGPGTGNTLALKRDIDAEGVFTITTSSSEEVVANTSHVYSLVPTDTMMIETIIRKISKASKGEKVKVAFFIHPSSFGRSPIPGAKKLIQEKYPNIEVAEVVEHGNELDSTAVLRRFHKNNVRYMISHTFNFKIAPLLKEATKLQIKAHEMGEKGKITFMGTMYAGRQTLLDLAKEDAEGFYWTTSEGSFYEKNAGNAMVEAVAKHNKREKMMNNSNYRGGVTYVLLMVEIFKRAKASGGVDRGNIMNIVHQMYGEKSFSDQLTLGPLTYSKTDHTAPDVVGLYRVTNGKYILDESFEY